MALRGGFISGQINPISVPIWNTVLNITGKGMLNGVFLDRPAGGSGTWGFPECKITIDGSPYTFIIPVNTSTIAVDFYKKINLPFISSLKIEILNGDSDQPVGDVTVSYYIKYIKEI